MQIAKKRWFGWF